jgi:hypothetical protein
MDILEQAAAIVRAHALALATRRPEAPAGWDFKVGSIAPEFDI